MISSETFVPQSLENLTKIPAFPSPLPEAFYTKICKEYEAVSDAITQRIIYNSDGLQVNGITCFPAKIDLKKHPILIYNRGGTRDYGRLTVRTVLRAMLPFARTGYLVYASNYRGNDGGQGADEFGGDDLNDIFNLLEIAKQNPAWDGKNIFMLGHSRGGMMTYLSLRKDKTFNAAISIAGLSDLIEWKVERPLIEEQVYKTTIPNYLNSPDDAILNRSAVCWAEEISTPLLLLHGTADEAVSLGHSTRLAEKLAALGKIHELVIYEGGNHALLRHWDEVIAKCLSWFGSYEL